MAPIGNKNALGNNGGRPREYDRVQIAKDFYQWTLDHEDCLTVPHFTVHIPIVSSKMSDWANEDKTGEFCEWYYAGKEQIGLNRLNATLIEGEGKLDRGIYLKHVGNFDKDKHRYDRQEKVFDSSLKNEEQAKVAEEVIAQNERLMALVSKRQSDFIKEESIKRAECKSELDAGDERADEGSFS